MVGADDAKIAELVRTVLHAVDLRLEQVRADVHALAADVERRHAEVLHLVSDLDGRLAARPDSAATGGSDPLASRMEQATQVLLERIEALHQRNTIATNERFTQVSAEIDQIRGSNISAPLSVPATQRITPLQPSVPASLTGATLHGSPPPPAPPSSTLLADMASMSAPLRTSPAPMGPVIEPIAAARAAPSDGAPAAEQFSTYNGGEDTIDLDRLGDLLAERLAHLKLPSKD
ncbi:MAG: hypothetical protein Q7V88_11935 [Actinomycetota bacterium]|nr:hypothetical protein [Actinomycetota bacterium]